MARSVCGLLFVLLLLHCACCENFPRASARTGAEFGKGIREQGPSQRIPRQQAQNTGALDGIVRDTSSPNNTLPIPGAILTLRNL
jgi:hypothetical protein